MALTVAPKKPAMLVETRVAQRGPGDDVGEADVIAANRQEEEVERPAEGVAGAVRKPRRHLDGVLGQSSRSRR